MTIDPKFLTYAGVAVVVVLVVAFRLSRAARVRPLNANLLWVVPAIYALIVGGVFFAWPPADPQGWAFVGASAILGAAFGWWRGSMVSIARDAASGQLMQQASAAALLVIPALIAVRFALREAVALEGDANVVHLAADMLVVFMFGLLAFQRIEMYFRAQRL